MAYWVICNRWIDEVQGRRCVLSEGHDGPCRSEHLAPARPTRMLPSDYAEQGPVIDLGAVAPKECEACDATDADGNEFCEGCDCCQECCNCTDSDCDCPACTIRRELAD